jgi:hypothetical protein
MDRLSWAIGHKFSAEPVRCSGHIDNNVVAARFNENSSAMAMAYPSKIPAQASFLRT